MNEFETINTSQTEGISPIQQPLDEESTDTTSEIPHIESNASTIQNEESSYTFITGGSPQGRGYTTPEGAHGFVYTPTESPKGAGVGKKLIIAMCTVGTVFLLIGCCIFGAWAMSRFSSPTPGIDQTTDENGESSEALGTAGSFVIVDDLETQSESEKQTMNSANRDNPVDSSNGDYEPDYAPEIPEINDNINISKKEPQRKDQNGDGKADLAFDEYGQVITSAGNNILSIPTVVSKVGASVVEISTETLVQSSWIGQYVTSGAGSGVIVSSDGYIVTNHHVIDGADTILVRLNDGTEFNATLVGTDKETDIAVLLIDPGNYQLSVASLGSSYDLVAGEDIIAIGNPLGSLGGTVTEGIISATERLISVDGNNMKLLQVSAPINPGNSGGGLFNLAGELIGVVNAKMSSEEIEGLGFAIPVDTAYKIICELIEYRYIRGRVTTGLTLVNVDSIQTAMYYFNSRYTGVYVYDSVSDVLKYGDLILSVNGTEITSSEQISSLIKGYSVGDVIDFVIYRDKNQITVSLQLMEYVPEYLKEDQPPLNPAA